MLRINSPLEPEVEQLLHATIGCCLRVHRELGPGLLELTYVRAISIELAHAGVPYAREKCVKVFYRGELLTEQRLDLVVAGRLVVEVKSVAQLAPVHSAQLLSYLRASGLRVGLLLNFNVARLSDGMRRIVL